MASEQECAKDRENHQRLLLRLSRDPERAQTEYDDTRQRMVKFFECKRCPHPQELADKTMRIVAEEWVDQEFPRLVIGIARRVLKELTQEDFDRLLSRFHPDPHLAGMEYDSIHARLVKFFENKKCRSPQDLADKTLDTLAKKLAYVDVINVDDYTFRIAMMVIFDAKRMPEDVSFEDNLGGKAHPEHV